MEPTRFNLNLRSNAHFDAVITLRDAAGRPLDLSGWRFKLQVRARPKAALLAEWPVTTPAPGQIRVLLEPATIRALTFTSGAYDIVATDPDGRDSVILEGAVTVRLGVTER